MADLATMTAISTDLTARGLIHQVTDEALLAKLDHGGVTTYAGFDPTADSLHVGSLLQLCQALHPRVVPQHRPPSVQQGHGYLQLPRRRIQLQRPPVQPVGELLLRGGGPHPSRGGQRLCGQQQAGLPLLLQPPRGWWTGWRSSRPPPLC